MSNWTPMMLNGSRYYVIAYYPDLISGEKINVGVIGVGKGGTRHRLISDTAWHRIAAWTNGSDFEIGASRNSVLYWVGELTDEAAIEDRIAGGFGDYGRVVVHPQGSSVDGTEDGINLFFAQMCGIAEGHSRP